VVRRQAGFGQGQGASAQEAQGRRGLSRVFSGTVDHRPAQAWKGRISNEIRPFSFSDTGATVTHAVMTHAVEIRSYSLKPGSI
jgi:hypothetical protein